MHNLLDQKLNSAKTFFAKEYNLLLLAAWIGFLAGVASTVFRWMIDFFQAGFSADSLIWLGVPLTLIPLLLPLRPMLGGLVIGTIWRFFPKAIEENGVHKVLEAMALKSGKIKKRSIFVCASTSAITIGSGGSAGRVGPTVQIGSAIGSAFGQLFRLSTERIRVLVGAGAAAGIAASFNAPLAGVLFSMEIILGEFTISTFSPIVIAAVIGTVTGRAIEGNELTFLTPVHELVSHTEIIFYLLLGLICGLTARLFTQSFFWTRKFFDERVRLPLPLKPALGGLVVGLLSVITPHIMGNGFEEMELALGEQLFWGWTLGLIFLKIIATASTLGSGGIGGTFAPTLFVGSMVGASFGAAAHALLPGWTATSGTYALVGMGALASAVLQAPLTSILMLFEMTNDYTMILPIMASCIVSCYTYRYFNKNSIYVQELLDRGINLRHGRAVSILSAMRVRDVMKENVVTVAEDLPFQKILETVSYSKNFYFPVVNDQGDMTGMLSFSDIRGAVLEERSKDLLTAGELSTKEVVTLNPNHNLNEAMEKFSDLEADQLPVVQVGNPRKVIGMISRADVMAAYNREMLIQETRS